MMNDPLSYSIIGAAMKVHREFGQGFQEIIYQRCLAIEFEKAGLIFSRERNSIFIMMAKSWAPVGPTSSLMTK